MLRRGNGHQMQKPHCPIPAHSENCLPVPGDRYLQRPEGSVGPSWSAHPSHKHSHKSALRRPVGDSCPRLLVALRLPALGTGDSPVGGVPTSEGGGSIEARCTTVVPVPAALSAAGGGASQPLVRNASLTVSPGRLPNQDAHFVMTSPWLLCTSKPTKPQEMMQPDSLQPQLSTLLPALSQPWLASPGRPRPFTWVTPPPPLGDPASSPGRPRPFTRPVPPPHLAVLPPPPEGPSFSVTSITHA